MKELAKTLLFGTGGPTVILECRRCGTTVSSTAARCPQCGADAISEYVIA